MKRKYGYTLIEVMVSALVLGVLSVGGAAMLRNAGGSIQYQQQYRAALAAATSRMETLIYEEGIDALKARTSGSGWDNTESVLFVDGSRYEVEEQIINNGNIEVRVRVSGRATEDITLCYIGTPRS